MAWLILYRLTLLLLLMTIVIHAENPLARLFMMKRAKGDRARNGGGGGSGNDATCVNPNVLEEVQKQLAVSESLREQALQEGRESAALAAKAQRNLEEYQKDTEVKIDQLARALESAAKIAKLQEDVSKRFAEMQQNAERELAATKAEIEKKDQQLRQVRVEHDQFIDTLKENADRRLKETDDQWRQTNANIEQEAHKRIHEVELDLGKKITELHEAKAMMAGEVKTLEEKYEEMQQKYELAPQDRQAALDNYLKQRLDQEVDRKSGDIIRNLEARLDEVSQSLRGLEVSSSTTIANLNDNYAKLEQEFHTAIHEANEKATKEVEALKIANQQELNNKVEELTTKHKREKDVLMKKLDEAEMERKNIATANAQMTRDLKEAKANAKREQKDAVYWKTEFEQRSYFNWTYVSGDTFAAIDKVAAPAIQTSINLSKKNIVPLYDKTRELYQTYFYPYALKAIEIIQPYYNQYAAQHVSAAAKKFADFQKSSRKMVQKTKKEFVVEYKKSCKSTLRKFRTTPAVPPLITETLRYSCDNPEDVLVTSLKVWLAIFVFLFNRSLWRLFLGTIRFIVNTIWFFSPIRFLFFRSKEAKESAKPVKRPTSGTVPVKQEKETKVNNGKK
jgi:DNA repair exonuclease SbcCD ATPase subunit